LQAKHRVFQIARLATVGLRFDNDDKIIRYSVVAKARNPLAISLIDMKGV